jgi:uncharacterized protein YecT (DUF1311 family)
MNLSFRIAVMVLLLLASKAAFAICDEGMNYGEKRGCVKEQVRKSDQELNVVYRDLRRAIAALPVMAEPGNLGEMSPKELDNALVRGQRAWLAFRDEECRYDSEYYAGGTGTLAGMMGSICEYKLNKARTATLRQRLADLKED